MVSALEGRGRERTNAKQHDGLLRLDTTCISGLFSTCRESLYSSTDYNYIVHVFTDSSSGEVMYCCHVTVQGGGGVRDFNTTSLSSSCTC